MQPKTKFQKYLVKIDRSLPKISLAQKSWAFKNCLMHKAIRQKSGNITCLDCGHSWKSDFKNSWTDSVISCTCPNCKTKLKIEETRVRNFSDNDYFTILTTHKGFQVIRKFEVSGYYKLREKARLFTKEVSRIYMTGSGEFVIIGYSFMSNFYGVRWFGGFELKHNNTIKNHSFLTNYVYPRQKFIKRVLQNGFTRDTYNLSYFNFFYAILRSSKTETLLKAKQIPLFKSSTDYYESKKVDKYWNSIKICIRNNYLVLNSSDWFDYLNLLDYFKKDLNNAKYVCPKDFKHEHNKYVERKRKVLLKEKIERMKTKIKKEQKLYAKAKKQYFGLVFKKEKITVKVIDKVQDVLELSDKFRHCMYVNEYHNKENSLLMCALVDNIPTETIEFDLKDFKVKQARGLFNQPSEYNNEIVQLVQNHAMDIKHHSKINLKTA